MTALVVSPHLDDAVLSCGEWIARHPGTTIVTVLAGTPKGNRVLTTYDERCGFLNAGEALDRRRAEDVRAAAVLDAYASHLSFVDGQYRPRDQAARIVGMFAADDSVSDPLLIPVGLGHPDHELVARCVTEAVHRKGRTVWLYEDLPYRVIEPRAVGPALDAHRARGWKIADDPVTVTPEMRMVARKAAAVACYQSQLWSLDEHAVLAPERIWEATWIGPD